MESVKQGSACLGLRSKNSVVNFYNNYMLISIGFGDNKRKIGEIRLSLIKSFYD